MRLGAYSGVMAARIHERQQAEQPGGAAPSRGAAAPRGASTDDPGLVTKLKSEGWLEHVVEKE